MSKHTTMQHWQWWLYRESGKGNMQR